ncbi:uncharacterized protein G2W53_045206 [Senna tora]|uniref:Uncharacterized protein n=1 Tax=Senna tora TaxID=362788 RepID=A0A834SCH1_9FABA|nr:uncharacterized protein G2W53_045206 [Senna tora]
MQSPTEALTLQLKSYSEEEINTVVPPLCSCSLAAVVIHRKLCRRCVLAVLPPSSYVLAVVIHREWVCGFRAEQAK